VIIGASLYAQVGQYAWVPNSAISEGKNTGLFTQVYMTPSSSVPYLVGRCLASFVDSLPVVAISFGLAYYAAVSLLGQQLPLIVSPVSIAMVMLAMLTSFPAAVGLGLMLGAYSLFASKLEWALPSYIAGALMIFSEALFPLSILPWPLSVVGQFVPFTYLMRASRAALLDPAAQGYFFNLGECVLTSVVALVLGLAAYRWGETRAREKGFLDRKTR
jgi:ABC-2 type transport system permease protein